MGKIRIRTLGTEDEKKEKQEAKKRAEAKRIEDMKAAGQIKSGDAVSDVIARSDSPEENAEATKSREAGSGSARQSLSGDKKEEAPEKKKAKNKYAEKKAQKPRRGKKYLDLVAKVNKSKTYSLKDALELLPSLKRAKFDETVELHINTIEKGISGSLSLPHGTGKKTRVKIANDEVLMDIEKGIIDFDVLIAEPSFMAKLAKVAKVLGPRGLMPNPKNGTISPKPDEVAKKFEGGQLNYKTEGKAPIIHISVGKVSFGPEKLSENIKVLISSIQKKNIKDITLKSTMSPGIKISL